MRLHHLHTAIVLESHWQDASTGEKDYNISQEAQAVNLARLF